MVVLVNHDVALSEDVAPRHVRVPVTELVRDRSRSLAQDGEVLGNSLLCCPVSEEVVLLAIGECVDVRERSSHFLKPLSVSVATQSATASRSICSRVPTGA